VVRGAGGAWLVVLVASTVALLTAVVLPRWMKVIVDMGAGKADEVDIGLWQSCRPYTSIYNCTALNTSTLSGLLSVRDLGGYSIYVDYVPIFRHLLRLYTRRLTLNFYSFCLNYPLYRLCYPLKLKNGNGAMGDANTI